MFNRLYRSIACIALLLFSSACAQFPNTNQDPDKNNRTSYNKDLRQCQEDYPQVASGAHIPQWIGCMKLKGWS